MKDKFSLYKDCQQIAEQAHLAYLKRMEVEKENRKLRAMLYLMCVLLSVGYGAILLALIATLSTR